MAEIEKLDKSALEELAASEFPELTEAEKRLLGAAVLGGPAYCGPVGKSPDAPENLPAHASSWSIERQIRADLLSWLCVDRDANKIVRSRGLTVACAKIVGQLNLSAARIRFPLIFFRCCFSEGIILVHADLFLFSADGCVVKPKDMLAISADFLRVRTLNLRHSFHAIGGVNLRGAEIANNLECDAARITNPTGTALSLNAARIGGSVFLRYGFIAEGEVNLAGAAVGLGLDCSRARFESPGARAFTADDAKIGRKN